MKIQEAEPDYKAMRKQLIEDNKLALKCEFVPHSRSRNYKPTKNDREKLESWMINWKVTLLKDGREVITTDYSQGIGHHPEYERNGRGGMVVAVFDALEKSLETGFYGMRKKLPEPKLEDVLYSLIMDSDVLEYSNFEEYAKYTGFCDPDSRKGEKIYRDCLEIALKLRSHLGEKLMSDLREAFQDY